jgi:hypothetical protein
MSFITAFSYFTGHGVSRSFDQVLQEAQVSTTDSVARVETGGISITDGSMMDFFLHGTKRFAYAIIGGTSIKMVLTMSFPTVSSFRLFLCNPLFRVSTRMVNE